MSQNINLFNPALRKRRDRLSARNLALTAALGVLALAAYGLLAAQRADRLAGEAAEVASRLKTGQAQLAEINKQIAQRKPDGKLAAELAQAEALLKARQEVIATLESGATIGKTEGFAETMRAFARQSVSGLWLTGFAIAAGGSDMEIRGRVLNPELLPVYIRRLNGEKAFQGRQFAALDMKGVAETPAARPGAVAAPRAAEAAALQALPAYIEFSLASTESAGGRKP